MSTVPAPAPQAPDAASRLTRALIADFDSVHQAELVERVGVHEAWWRLRAQLRSAHLLAERIVITDAQLLDGIYFLALGPAKISEVLGESTELPLPITVVARDGDLARALENMRARPDFEWSSDRVADAMSIVPDTRTLDRSREEWVAAAARGQVHVEPFRTEFPIAQILRDAPPPPTPDLPRDLVAELRTLTRRSVARAVISRAELPAEAAVSVRQWWEEAYAAALARQHNAAWLMFGEQGNRRVSGGPREDPVRHGSLQRLWEAGTRTLRRRRLAGQAAPGMLELDGSMLTTMAAVPPGLFATIVFRTQDARTQWTERRDAASLLSLALAVRTHTSSVESWLTRYRATWVRTVVLLAAMALALATAVLPQLSGWIVLPVLAALLGEMPYAEFRSLLSERPAKLRGVIHLPDPTGSGPLGLSAATVPTPSDRPSAGWAGAEIVYHWTGPPQLTMERRVTGTGRLQHRLVTQGGREGVIVVARHAGDILLVRQFRDVVGEELWELPRGFGQPDDAGRGPGTSDAALVAAATRELREETGLELLDASFCGRWWPDSGLLAGSVGVVTGRVPRLETQGPTDGEVAATRWVPEGDIDELVVNGTIRDGLSLAAIMACRAHGEGV